MTDTLIGAAFLTAAKDIFKPSHFGTNRFVLFYLFQLPVSLHLSRQNHFPLYHRRCK